MNLEFDLTGLADVLRRVVNLEKLAQRVMPAALEAVRQVWQDQVSGGLIDDPRYAEAMRQESSVIYPFEDDVFRGRVQVPASQQAHAATIERGRPARDMKIAMLKSAKVKRNKQGGKYLVVPLGFKAAKPGAFSPSRTMGMLTGTSPFRVVSEKSRADSWIYPGKEPVHVLQSVKELAQERMQRIFEQELRHWKA